LAAQMMPADAMTQRRNAQMQVDTRRRSAVRCL
jgi:hypothetical protein